MWIVSRKLNLRNLRASSRCDLDTEIHIRGLVILQKWTLRYTSWRSWHYIYFLTFRTLFCQPTGRKLKRVVFSVWNLSVTCFPNLLIKPLSRKTFWIWWTSLVWLRNLHQAPLVPRTLYPRSSRPHPQKFANYTLPQLIHVHYIFISEVGLFRKVSSYALFPVLFPGAVRLGRRHHLLLCTKMVLISSLSASRSSMILFFFARKVLSRLRWSKEMKMKSQFQCLNQLKYQVAFVSS